MRSEFTQPQFIAIIFIQHPGQAMYIRVAVAFFNNSIKFSGTVKWIQLSDNDIQIAGRVDKRREKPYTAVCVH